MEEIVLDTMKITKIILFFDIYCFILLRIRYNAFILPHGKHDGYKNRHA